MGFTLHTSNKTENLLEHLATVLKTPLPTVFDQDVFLIQSQGMERWLLQGLSDKFGVMANYKLLFPNRFFNEIAEKVCFRNKLKPEAFARERLVWTVDEVLHEIVTKQESGYHEVLGYLANGQVNTKRFQLAQQLTQLFDQYQVYRPCLVDELDPQHWSLKIWQRVIQKLGVNHHIGQAWKLLIDTLNNENLDQGVQLPNRITVFGIHSMPVVFLQVLQALAKHVDVHLYVTQPSEGYWGDLRRRSDVKRDKILSVFVDDTPDVKPDEINHPLLSLLGQQGRDFHQLLVEYGKFDWEFDSFEDEADSALKQLQNDIRLNKSSGKIPIDDGTIQCVSCHSRMREMQVLKDFLKQTLNDNADIELRDIVVMAPKISDYEPFIITLFDDANLKYAIADKSARNGNETYETLMSLLQLLGGRFEWNAVIDLLEREPIKLLLKLSDQDIDQLNAWVEQTYIRWGKSSKHKRQLGLPELRQNTWDAGLEQMMMGFVMQGQSVSIEGSQGQLLAKLNGFVRGVLFRYSVSSATAKTLKDWHLWMSELLSSIFDEQNPTVQSLNRTMETLPTIDSTQKYDINTIMAWLEETVSEQKNSQGFMAGQLTFCSILPMRSIPFKIVCVLGLNEGEFPRQDRRPSFDLMASEFLPGDRSARVDDRYQFLEILLSAREKLYLSYVGQSQFKPQEIPPSVVLQELLDELEFDKTKFPVKHPLQAFSIKYFSEDESIRTFSESALKTAQSLLDKKKVDPVWFDSDRCLPVMESRDIEFDDFIFFATEPQKWFMKNRLGIQLSSLSNERSDYELFEIKGLDRYQIEQSIFNDLISGKSEKDIHSELSETGAWMSGEIGSLTLTETINSVNEMVIETESLQLGAPMEPFLIDEQVNELRIVGSISQHYKNGFLLACYARLKPKDYVRAWLIHLFSGKTVFLLGLDEKRNIVQFTLDGDRGSLTEWIHLYEASHISMPQYWPELGWAYLTSMNKKKGKKGDSDDKRERLTLDAANKAVSDKFRSLTVKDTYGNNFPDEHLIKLTKGYAFEDIWTEKSKNVTLSLLSPIHALTQEAKQ